jgi:hypothetical protein
MERVWAVSKKVGYLDALTTTKIKKIKRENMSFTKIDDQTSPPDSSFDFRKEK